MRKNWNNMKKNWETNWEIDENEKNSRKQLKFFWKQSIKKIENKMRKMNENFENDWKKIEII